MAVLNAPGSWHDAHVVRLIYDTLKSDVPNGYFLVVDTAFPRGTASIARKIQALIIGGEYIPADTVEQCKAMQVNRQLLCYRQTAKWGMHMLQGSFGRLQVPLDINSEEGRREILELCTRLSNIQAQCVGINQIWNVYMPIWKGAEDEEL